jgi:hypothetical protein
MNKLFQALRLIKYPEEKVQEPDFMQASLENLYLSAPVFSLLQRMRLTAEFHIDFYANASDLTPAVNQAKKVLLEGMLSDIRVHIEKLRLSIVTRDGTALQRLEDLEKALFEID